MRIISQDRTYSINMEQHDLWIQSATILCKTDTGSYVLGVYSSVERAKEVFNIIHEPHKEPVFIMPEK